ncbi:MAG: acyltransferase [Crocinitomicaceae bacterium]|nr:acyltransferase [Crocinitomicaceae bacterium]
MQGKFYLPGLDGLRAIASMAVVVGHIELCKQDHGYANFFNNIKLLGTLGVILFFVLSGFLITTLLLKEKKEHKKINIRNFYVRRILRVWPLYYIILLLSALIFMYSPSWFTLLLCGTIFPNIAHAFSSGWLVSPQLWSIGVEEQFYLFWPAILRGKERTILLIAVFLTFAYPILPHVTQFVLSRLDYSNSSLKLVEVLFEVLNFGSMGTGALFAILYFGEYPRFNNWRKRLKPLNLLFVILPFALWFGNVNFSYVQFPVYSLLFGYMITILIDGNYTFIFESRIFKFLGKISYGIYMYHWILMLLFVELFAKQLEGGWLGSLVFYISTIVGTIVIAYLSHKYIESFFLKLKGKFQGKKIKADA